MQCSHWQLWVSPTLAYNWLGNPWSSCRPQSKEDHRFLQVIHQLVFPTLPKLCIPGTVIPHQHNFFLSSALTNPSIIELGLSMGKKKKINKQEKQKKIEEKKISASSSSSDSMILKSFHVFFITLLGTSPLPSSTALTDTSLGDGSRTRGRILSNSCLLLQHNLFQFADGPPDVDSAAPAPAGRRKAIVWTRERNRLGGLCADNWVEWRRGCRHWDAAAKAIVEPKRDKKRFDDDRLLNRNTKTSEVQ